MSDATLTASIAGLAPVSLSELEASAALQTRRDRKYLVTREQLDELLIAIGHRCRALDIEGRRCFPYETLYFDTPDLRCYLDAAHRRTQRFKVRTRTYVDNAECHLEVKMRNRHGLTVKERQSHDANMRAELSGVALDFLNSFSTIAPISVHLQPALITRYRRITLLIGATPSRVTIDLDLACIATPGRQLGLGKRVLVETKTDGRPSIVDRALWGSHIRPVSISKYCTGLAALNPSLPSNSWHRTIGAFTP